MSHIFFFLIKFFCLKFEQKIQIFIIFSLKLRRIWSFSQLISVNNHDEELIRAYYIMIELSKRFNNIPSFIAFLKLNPSKIL
jgi:hypothetical protein